MDLESLKEFEWPDMTLKNIITWGAAGAMIFGGVVPYIPQYRDIKRTENADGFSTYVCLALLIANTLRILFWFGKHFESPLLAQSIIMLIAMMVMMRLCTKVKIKTELISSKVKSFSDRDNDRTTIQGTHTITERHFRDFDRQYFWKWTYFSSYVEFMAAFFVVGFCLTFLLLESDIYIEVVGFLAVFTEAMLGTPQFYRNFQNRSTMGMSVKMVGCWMMGDTFKTGYFILREAPIQFWVCGLMQVSIDLSILFQVWLYKGNVPHRQL